jgi:hypothetical protein
LEKQSNAPYPWAVCIDDLESFLNGLKFRNKRVDNIFSFLRQREKLHGRTFCDDELNICGYFLENDTLPTLPDEPKKRYIFTPENSSVFDEYFLKNTECQLSEIESRSYKNFFPTFGVKQNKLLMIWGFLPSQSLPVKLQ